MADKYRELLYIDKKVSNYEKRRWLMDIRKNLIDDIKDRETIEEFLVRVGIGVKIIEEEKKRMKKKLKDKEIRELVIEYGFSAFTAEKILRENEGVRVIVVESEKRIYDYYVRHYIYKRYPDRFLNIVDTDIKNIKNIEKIEKTILREEEDKKIKDDIEIKDDIREYYRKKGLDMNKFEGGLMEEHKIKYLEAIRRIKDEEKLRLIIEIGFNDGRSAEYFLRMNEKVRVISFDLLEHEYSYIGKKYIDNKYRDRHILIGGSSLNSITAYSKIINDIKREIGDVIFIDGGHIYDIAYSDIINMKEYADKETAVIIDNVVAHKNSGRQVYYAYRKAVDNEIILNQEIYEIGRYTDGFGLCVYNKEGTKYKNVEMEYEKIERKVELIRIRYEFYNEFRLMKIEENIRNILALINEKKIEEIYNKDIDEETYIMIKNKTRETKNDLFNNFNKMIIEIKRNNMKVVENKIREFNRKNYKNGELMAEYGCNKSVLLIRDVKDRERIYYNSDKEGKSCIICDEINYRCIDKIEEGIHIKKFEMDKERIVYYISKKMDNRMVIWIIGNIKQIMENEIIDKLLSIKELQIKQHRIKK
jgi:predicted O-methyltransferase YrrM